MIEILIDRAPMALLTFLNF
jgi:hypothetical protein